MQIKKYLPLIVLVVALIAAAAYFEAGKGNLNFKSLFSRSSTTAYQGPEPLEALKVLESKSPLIFDKYQNRIAFAGELPSALSLFIAPHTDTNTVKVETDPKTEGIYYLNYTVPENLTKAREYFLQTASQNNYRTLSNKLADSVSSLDFVSMDYQVRVSLVKIAEKETEVFIYASPTFK